MKLEFSIAGLEQFKDALDKFGERVIPTTRDSLYYSAEAIMTVSKEQYCPVDTGALRSSGTVQVEIRGSGVEVQLGYGGAAAAYGGKQWKFLETPLKAGLGDINAALIEDFNAMLSGR